ncbi:MAG: hypothetical protein HRT71_00160 [Flavobacteriales bacterium]|nr:hypothetical protein [Flavobacteriales bacterium]
MEQSIEIRKEIREKEFEFDKIIEKNNLNEELLKNDISELEERIRKHEVDLPKRKNASKSGNSSSSYSSSDFDELKSNKKVFGSFMSVAQHIRENEDFPKGTGSELKEFYLINDIVEEKIGIHSLPYYRLTFKGNGLYQDHFNAEFNKKHKES